MGEATLKLSKGTVNEEAGSKEAASRDIMPPYVKPECNKDCFDTLSQHDSLPHVDVASSGEGANCAHVLGVFIFVIL